MDNNKVENFKYRLNLILIALLCSTTLAPCLIFYVRGAGKLTWMLIFILTAYLISLLPGSFYDRIQLSQRLSLYKKLGVDKFKKLSTNGDLINKIIRNKYPGHRNIKNLKTIEEKLYETYTIEKSHTVLFVFCLLTNIYAFMTESYTTAGILFVGNFLFNFYPNLLQQYNRIRYKSAIRKFGIF